MDWKKVINPFLWVMTPIVAFCYAITPLTNDARIYFGVEHIAASYYPFPAGIDLAWEIKPVANRLTNFILYKIATLFVPFDNHFLFGVAVKLIALVAIICVAAYFARVVAVPYAFLLVFYTFAAIANFCTMQAEYWAALWSLAAVAMLVSGSRAAWYGSGALMVWVFLLKGITGLLVIPVMCGAFLLLSKHDDLDLVQMIIDLERDLERITLFIFGFVSAAALFLLLSLIWWPHVMADMLLSPHLARVGMVGALNIIVWFIAQLVMSPLYIPVLLIGIVFGAIFFFAVVRYQDPDFRIAYELMWLVPAAIVMVQGEMFLYHYLAFVPAAVVTVLLCEREVEG